MKPTYEEVELALWEMEVQFLQQTIVAANLKGVQLEAMIRERKQWLQQQGQSIPSP
jgi:hypothetical protein